MPEPESDAEFAPWSDFFVFLTFSALNAGSSSRAVFFAAEDELLLSALGASAKSSLTRFASASVAIARLATASAAMGACGHVCP
jgi:hypothetical protein